MKRENCYLVYNSQMAKSEKKMRYEFIKILVLALFTISTGAYAQNSLRKTKVPEVALLPGIPTLDARSFKSPDDKHIVEEFVIKGNATSYKAAGELGADGQWNVVEDNTLPYTSRFVVIRPLESKKFNGTVVVEWLNVTAGFDFSPARIQMWRELARNGSIWIGVSAQIVGIQGGPTVGGMDMPLKKLNAERYKELSHPGDAYSFDIFSQVGRFLKESKASSVLGGIVPKQVIAMGESQSAFYLTTYINAIDSKDKVYDGFLNYSRFGFAASLDKTLLQFLSARQEPVRMRSDLRVPVLILETESDVVGASSKTMSFLGYYTARQPESDMLRIWEVTGTAHADSYLHQVSRIDNGTASYSKLSEAYAPTNDMQGVKLDKAYNNAPQHHYVLQGAIAALEKWVATGKAPAKADPIELLIPKAAGEIAVTIKDQNGNAKKGVRSPWMDVPVSKLSGTCISESFNAMLAGTVEPFDAQTLQRLYPNGRAEYLKKFKKALNAQIKAGFILAADKKEILEVAKLSYKGTL